MFISRSTYSENYSIYRRYTKNLAKGTRINFTLFWKKLKSDTSFFLFSKVFISLFFGRNLRVILFFFYSQKYSLKTSHAPLPLSPLAIKWLIHFQRQINTLETYMSDLYPGSFMSPEPTSQFSKKALNRSVKHCHNSVCCWLSNVLNFKWLK